MLRPLRGTLSPLGRALGGASSWWLSGGVSAANCVAAYAPKGAASLAASYTNLANPGTYDAAPGVAPSWSAATGWTFDGSTQYLKTGVTPGNGWAMIVRFSGAAMSSYTYIAGSYGVTEATSRFFVGSHPHSFYGYGAFGEGAVTITAGVLAIANGTGYRDGTSDVAGLGSIGSDGGSIYIGAANRPNSGGVQGKWTGNVLALAIYNTSIASYIAALTTAMNAL